MDSHSSQIMADKIERVQEGGTRIYDLLEQLTVLKEIYDALAVPIENMPREVDDLREFFHQNLRQESQAIRNESAKITTVEFMVELLERLSRVTASLLEAQGIQQAELAIIYDIIQGSLYARVLAGKIL